MAEARKVKERVRAHWNARPCGSTHAASPVGSRPFFEEVEAARYQLEPFIPDFAEFSSWREKKVLEVGIGMGTDLAAFARAGAIVSGIDLTEAAVTLAKQRLALEGLRADVAVADAEALPFNAETFDLVYSWGVLHHTPATQRAINEIHRVLKPGGEARVMVYSRRSWFAFGLWVRHALLHGRPWRSIQDVISNHLESPGTKAYTESELRAMFCEFRHVDIHRYVTPYDRRVAGPAAFVVGSRLGWFAGIRALRSSCS